MRGYVVGPTLTDDEPPWPSGWEQDPQIDECDHIWESCLLLPGPRRGNGAEVVRCMKCHVPRCGHASSADRDPCMRRRHHRDPHRYLSGREERVGA